VKEKTTAIAQGKLKSPPGNKSKETTSPPPQVRGIVTAQPLLTTGEEAQADTSMKDKAERTDDTETTPKKQELSPAIGAHPA
jgi:hypothetical protein